jgi:hypothetical protein
VEAADWEGGLEEEVGMDVFDFEDFEALLGVFDIVFGD